MRPSAGIATARLTSKKWFTHETENGERRIIFGSNLKTDEQAKKEKLEHSFNAPSKKLADDGEYIEVGDQIKLGCVSEIDKHPFIASESLLKNLTYSYTKELSEKTNTDIVKEEFLLKEELPENAKKGTVLEIYVDVPHLPDLRVRKVNPRSWNFEQLVTELADRDQLLALEHLQPLVDMQVDGDALLKSSLTDLVNVVGMQYSPAVRVLKIVRDLQRSEDQGEIN